MNPKVKVLALVGFVSLTAVLQSYLLLGWAALLVLGITIWTGVPVQLMLRRVAWLIPFAGVLVVLYPFITPGEMLFRVNLAIFTLEASGAGVLKAIVLLLRVLNAVLAGCLLTATTSFPDLMKALRELKVPSVLVSLLEFTVRYIFVLTDEVERMRTARKARCFDAGKNLLDLRTMRTLGLFVGVLFCRSFERGERVYQAMLSRGYSGEG